MLLPSISHTLQHSANRRKTARLRKKCLLRPTQHCLTLAFTAAPSMQLGRTYLVVQAFTKALLLGCVDWGVELVGPSRLSRLSIIPSGLSIRRQICQEAS